MGDMYFEISNLECAYHTGKMVLKIGELQIPKGEMVFIVGQSGCGKSTILETLGLMNNTMQPSPLSKIVFNTPDGESIDYMELWSRKNNNKFLSDIRRRFFSFIFQQTNLMHNFNVYENIAITKMLQGASDIECRRITNEILREVALDDFIIMRDGGWSPESKIFGKSNEASGGQQQRMAFARALVSEYCVLFCDEPTGNLDPETADMLMNYLRTEITRKGNATAIIVSHDMKLATKYGDRIIKIFKHHRKEQADYYGYIDSESVFLRINEKWMHQNETISTDGIIDKLIMMDR